MNLPKGKIEEHRFSAAKALPVLADKTPAKEFQIFSAGVNDSDYGPIMFDEIAAAFVMEAWRTKGNGGKFDYNHGMAKDYPTAEEGKSAGDFDIEVRGGALMAVACMWTPEAYCRIQSGEYSLFSPWFETITTEDGIRRPCQLNNVAILNLAGLNRIQQIAAGIERNKETTMTDAEAQALRERNRVLETEIAELRASATEIATFSGSMQLRAGATAVDRAQAFGGLITLRDEVLRMTAKTTVPEAVGVLASIKARAAKADELEARLETDEQSAIATEIEHVFEMGAKADAKGEISTGAAPAAKKVWEDTVLAAMKRVNGGKLSKDMVVVARGHVQMAAKVRALGHTPGTEQATGGGAGTGTDLPLPPEIARIPGASMEAKQRAFQRQTTRRLGNNPDGRTSG